jgi:hypothetical protein
MKFEIHFEFRASLIKFQNLNFWDATLADLIIFLTLTRLVVVIIFENFSFALFTPPPLGDFQNVPKVIPRSVSEAAVNPSGASLRTPDQ